MADSFSISRSRCSLPFDPALHDEIRAHTDSDVQVASILRSIERFGTDESIRYYEMTPKAARGAQRGRGIAWSVKAVRT